VGDRLGLGRTILAASVVYGLSFVAAGLAEERALWFLGPIFLVAIAGGTVMTLAWGLLFTLMPEQHRGAVSGLATTTKGIGLVVGPLVAGAAIDVVGYRALWPVCGAFVLLSVPLVAGLSGRRARPAA
jgi:MFS family permease